MTTLERQLRLLRWFLKHGARWVESFELRKFYGQPMAKTPRRTAERDLRALQRAGVPLEWELGRWRLSPQKRKTWLRIRRKAPRRTKRARY